MQEGKQPLFQKELAINTTDSTPILRCGHHTCFMRTRFFLVPSSVKVNSSMNHTNRQGSTWERGGEKKKHKALLASVAPNAAAAAAANFHTLNIYFDSLLVRRCLSPS
jgi:hypothetical protein